MHSSMVLAYFVLASVKMEKKFFLQRFRQKIVPCINVRPYVFHDLMMTLPDFVKHFYPELTIEKARQLLQDILKVVIYKGNR